MTGKVNEGTEVVPVPPAAIGSAVLPWRGREISVSPTGVAATPAHWAIATQEHLREMAVTLRAGRRVLTAEDESAVGLFEAAAEVMGGKRAAAMQPASIAGDAEPGAQGTAVALEAGMAAVGLLDRRSATRGLCALVRADERDLVP